MICQEKVCIPHLFCRAGDVPAAGCGHNCVFVSFLMSVDLMLASDTPLRAHRAGAAFLKHLALVLDT